jgi:hypothetical protein
VVFAFRKPWDFSMEAYLKEIDPQDLVQQVCKTHPQSMAARAKNLQEISTHWDGCGALSKQHLCPPHFSNQVLKALCHLSRVVGRQEAEHLLEEAVTTRRQRKGFRHGTNFVTFTDVTTVMQQKGEFVVLCRFLKLSLICLACQLSRPTCRSNNSKPRTPV